MTKPLTDAQRAYESKRAAKAGVSLEKWLATKEQDRKRDDAARTKAAKLAAAPPKKPGFFGRLLQKAEKPL
jgi:hypothetical protein